MIVNKDVIEKNYNNYHLYKFNFLSLNFSAPAILEH